MMHEMVDTVSRFLNREWNQSGGRMRRTAYRLSESSNQRAWFWSRKVSIR